MLAYAQAMPGDAVLVVDAHEISAGLDTVVQIAHLMRNSGFELAGILMRAGVNSILARYAREKLDAADLENIEIWVGDHLKGSHLEKLVLEGR